MIAKRGVLVVILILLVLVSSVVALEEATGFKEIYISTKEDHVGEIPGGDNELSFKDSLSENEGVSSSKCFRKGCSIFTHIGEGGCVWTCDNWYFCAIIKPGAILTADFQSSFIEQNSEGGYDEDHFCSNLKDSDCSTKDVETSKLKTPSSDTSGYICADNHLWMQCSEANKDKVSRVGNKIYNCTTYDSLPKWVALPGVDEDRDGYTTSMGDCADNPTASGLQTIGCPEAPDGCDENTQKCAVCINPDAPEVCGDGIGDGTDSDPTDGKGNDCNADTSDDCDKNQWACEQRADPTAGESTPIQTNIFGGSFSWINTAEGGHCCGYNDIDSLEVSV